MKALFWLAVDDWSRDYWTCSAAVSIGFPTGLLVAQAFWGWAWP